MNNSKYNKQIDIIASLMKSDNLSPDETDSAKLCKYHNHAKSEFGLNDDSAAQLIFESLMYLKLQDADLDPLSDGKKFGMGFS